MIVANSGAVLAADRNAAAIRASLLVRPAPVGVIDDGPGPRRQGIDGGGSRLPLQGAACIAGGEGDELLSPLVMPALPVATALALAELLNAAVIETAGDHDQPRAGLTQVVEQLRGMADLLETMTPAEHR